MFSGTSALSTARKKRKGGSARWVVRCKSETGVTSIRVDLDDLNLLLPPERLALSRKRHLGLDVDERRSWGRSGGCRSAGRSGGGRALATAERVARAYGCEGDSVRRTRRCCCFGKGGGRARWRSEVVKAEKQVAEGEFEARGDLASTDLRVRSDDADLTRCGCDETGQL